MESSPGLRSVPAAAPDLYSGLGLLILRVGIGGYMLTHGWSKVQMVRAGQFAMFGDPIGIGSELSLFLVMVAEFICALLVIVGLGTRFAAVPIVIAMTVAAFVAHGSDPWTMEQGAKLFMSGQAQFWGSKQPALTYAIVFLALVFTGAGRFSIDRLIHDRMRLRSHGNRS